MYSSGQGIPKDPIKGLAWATLAVSCPIEDPLALPGTHDKTAEEEKEVQRKWAARFRDFLQRKLTTQQVNEAQKLAADLSEQLKQRKSKAVDGANAKAASPLPTRAVPAAPALRAIPVAGARK